MPFHYVQSVFFTFKFGFLLKCLSDKSTCCFPGGRSGSPEVPEPVQGMAPGPGSEEAENGFSVGWAGKLRGPVLENFSYVMGNGHSQTCD